MWASSKQCLASAGVPRSGFGPKPRCGFLTTTSLPASRRHLLDYVVVSVVEEVGCMDRNELPGKLIEDVARKGGHRC